jgi:hypothetical protein
MSLLGQDNVLMNSGESHHHSLACFIFIEVENSVVSTQLYVSFLFYLNPISYVKWIKILLIPFIFYFFLFVENSKWFSRLLKVLTMVVMFMIVWCLPELTCDLYASA